MSVIKSLRFHALSAKVSKPYGMSKALATHRASTLVVVETTADRRLDIPIDAMGGKGVFVKEIQAAVLDGRADLAVHSAKDLPSEPGDGLVIGAFGARRDPRDALIGRRLDQLAEGATVATGSVRRRAQLERVRPDLRFVELRGNIGTRLERIPDGGAIVMAVAALEILEQTDRIAEILDIDRMVPMVGQGAVAVECRDGDDATLGRLAAVDDATTRQAITLERAWLRAVGAGCTAPVGAHAADGMLHTFLAGTLATVQRSRFVSSMTDAVIAARADLAEAG